ncbi:trypsin-like serine peptidase, partial [Bacillus mycoides]
MKRNSQNTGNIVLDICDNLENCAGTPDTRHKLERTDFNVVRVTCETEDGIYGDWGTGTVIGPNKILTAAHVANIGRYHQQPLIVYAGEHGVGSVPKKYTVSSIKIHPSYRFSPGHPKHDLAVLTTNETFTQYKPFSRAPKPLDNTRLIWTGYPSD